MESERPVFPPAEREVDPAPDVDRLATRIVELRQRLAELAPRPSAPAPSPEAQQQRIVVLERLLAESRCREEELMRQLLEEASLGSGLYEQVVALTGAVARAGEAEALLGEALGRAHEAERRSSSLAEQARAHARENETLRLRVDGLENDLRAAVGEIAASAGDRVRAAQLVEERDEARAETEAERQAAMEGRLRATEAEARAASLTERVQLLETRLARLLGSTPGTLAGQAVVDLRGVEDSAGDTGDAGESSEPVGGPALEQEGWRDHGWS